MINPDILQALKSVTAVFEALEIPYFIGGSVASSLYGAARATLDVDLVADIKMAQIQSLQQRLARDHYVDAAMIRDALQRKSSFNLIHLPTMVKIDVFPLKTDPYDRETLQRKRKDTLGEQTEAGEFFFSSPEDIIIRKLEWYELGHRISDRQWSDILGVLKVQGANLDKQYLVKWCGQLNLLPLLEQACQNAGVTLSF